MPPAGGGLLTVQHRAAQLNLRAVALRDFAVIWPLWTGTDETFGRLIAATLPLALAHHRTSAALAATYYQALRGAQQVRGTATPVIATLDPQAVVASLYVTGQVMTRRALRAGQAPQAAMQTALVRTSGAVARHVLAGGRQTLVESTQADPRSPGYQRIPSAGACDFCVSLADEIQTDDFEAHDHCGCASEPRFI